MRVAALTVKRGDREGLCQTLPFRRSGAGTSSGLAGCGEDSVGMGNSMAAPLQGRCVAICKDRMRACEGGLGQGVPAAATFSPGLQPRHLPMQESVPADESPHGSIQEVDSNRAGYQAKAHNYQGSTSSEACPRIGRTAHKQRDPHE